MTLSFEVASLTGNSARISLSLCTGFRCPVCVIGFDCFALELSAPSEIDIRETSEVTLMTAGSASAPRIGFLEGLLDCFRVGDPSDICIAVRPVSLLYPTHDNYQK